MRKRPPFRFYLFVVTLIAGLAIFPLYSRFKQVAAPVPPGVLLGGIDLSHEKDPAAIRAYLEPIFRQPIGLRFRERTLVLYPEEIDFQVDIDAMLAAAGGYLEGLDFVDIALREAIGLPQQPRVVPVVYRYDEVKLRAWLTQQAAELDYQPIGARAQAPDTPALPTPTPGPGEDASAASLAATTVYTIPELGGAPLPVTDWQWLPGAPGYQVDIGGSIPRALGALASTGERVADLALIVTPPATPGMADLAGALARLADDFPGVAAIYVQDLTRGTEANVNADGAFSGMSTLKIALALALMDKLPNGVAAGDDAARQQGQLLDLALGESNNFAANQVLTWLGDGDLEAGARRFTALMQELGFESTYIQAGYDAAAVRPELPTPANRRTDLETEADANLQTTPQELGRILTTIYRCMEDEGVIRERRGASITPDECRAILFYMTHDEFRDLIWNGLPAREERWIVHKHGLAGLQHGDAALIWGPTGPYVLTIFLYRPGWLDWGTSNATMQEISRLVWQFFAFRAQQPGAAAPPPPPRLEPPPGYAPVADYAPSAANPAGQ